MTAVDNTIRQLGEKKKIKELQDYIANIDVNELTDMVEIKINNPHFPNTLNYLMQSFVDTDASHSKRIQVIKVLLSKVENNEGRSSQNNAIVSRIQVELPKLKTQHLVEICNLCMAYIQKGSVTEMSWKDLLPDLMNTLMERDVVEHNDKELPVTEYKAQVINSLCMMQWAANILTALTAMFINMPLSKEEHQMVVSKLCQSMGRLTPQEIPTFVYQLLELCKNQHGRGVFFTLQGYFGSRIYRDMQARESESNSESSSMDIIGNTSEQSIQQAESTVLYHIHQAAFLKHESVKDYLNSLKNVIKCPESILHPFQLSVLLSISNISGYEEKCFDLIRSSISNALREEERKTESCWIRETVSNSCQIDTVFNHLIQISVEERELVIEGLVKFAYVLLGVGSALGRDIIAEKQWKLGSQILLKLVKRKRQIAPDVIQTLGNCILTGQNVGQYTECVYMLSKNMALVMLENLTSTIGLMEVIVQVNVSVANDLLDAIIPLTKLSHTIRDQLILLLRKALYSSAVESRQVAVIGFLKLLKNLKISNLAALSQSSSSSGSFSSGRSIFTQISVNQTQQLDSTSNEALCLELLRILKRSFMQQNEVREQLYKELYNAVCMNPELGIPVLDAMWMHFSDYYVPDEDMQLPLNFNNIYIIKDPDVILREPIGKLIYCIGLIVLKVMETDDTNPTIRKFVGIMDSLVKRMINCELIHFELDDGTDLLDIVPESQKKVIVLKEALLVYEALIGYKICSWTPDSENCPQQINSLFQGYMRLIHFGKNVARPKKPETKKKKKADANKTTQDTNTKKDSTPKISAKNFKLPTTLLDFKAIIKLLSVLHKTDVSWTTAAQANIIKSRVELHRYAMQAAIDLVQASKTTRILDKQESKVIYDYYTDIAEILYERCISRIEEFLDFDTETAVLSAECFRCVVLAVGAQHKANMNNFFCDVANTEKTDDIVIHLTPIIENYQTMLNMENDDSEDDKKLSNIAINMLCVLVNHIPPKSSALSISLLEWLVNFANTKTSSNKQAATSLISLLLSMHLKFNKEMQIFETIAVRLGNIMGMINEEDETTDEMKLVNEMLVTSTFQNVCSCVKTILDDINLVINRLKAEYTLINYPGSDSSERRKDDIKAKERNTCCYLSFLVTVLTTMSNITIQLGPLSELLTKNVAFLYNTLNSLTKYFVLRSSNSNVAFQSARFERLVRLAGKQLSPVVYKLIMYLEECQKQTESTQGKKKAAESSTLKSKVLRETRQIPKVVFEIEQFSKSVSQLSKKTGVNLEKLIGPGTVRDFRIVNLREVLENQGGQDSANITHDSSHDNEESMEVDNENDESVMSDEGEPQSAKRARK